MLMRRMWVKFLL